MSYTNSLLKTLTELNPHGTFPQRMLVRDTELAATAEMEVHQLDRLSMELSMLRVTPENSVRDTLKSHAEKLARKVTGLMEKLNVIEIDDIQGVAMLRSDTPAVQDTQRMYYELMVNQQGTTTLKRYQGSTIHAERKEIPFVLTREALAKLITDLAG
jgi:adenine C2-methylase RlmN of 23S rRNA A2503 and tRNA A37